MQKRSGGRRTTSLEATLESGHWSNLKGAIAPENIDAYEDEQRQKRLRQQIGRLPAIYRKILWLRYVVGLPLHRTAAVLEISTPAAKWRIMRARAKLRILLHG